MTEPAITLPEPPLFRGDSRIMEPDRTTLQTLVERGVDTDQLEKLMELQERWERNDAAKQFGAALAKFQGECPIIYKTRTADIHSQKGSYKYQFASYDDVMRVAGPILSRCELAPSFSTEKTEHGIRVTCRIRHGIHYEDHTLDVPVPVMNVNDTQRYGAALSYAKRYALCAALNIVVSDEDDDAESQLETVTEEQAVTIREWMVAVSADEKRFLNWLHVQSIADIPADRFEEVVAVLKRKQGQR